LARREVDHSPLSSLGVPPVSLRGLDRGKFDPIGEGCILLLNSGIHLQMYMALLLEDEALKAHKLSRYRPEEAHGRSGRLRARIFLTFGTMTVVGRQPYVPAVFTPRSILVLIFRG
jgi:hypothetical protein